MPRDLQKLISQLLDGEGSALNKWFTDEYKLTVEERKEIIAAIKTKYHQHGGKPHITALYASIFYLRGDDPCMTDLDKAFTLCESPSQHGEPYAMTFQAELLLADIRIYGQALPSLLNESSPENNDLLKKAIELLTAAVNKKNGYAMWTLGCIYNNRFYGYEDQQKAASLFEWAVHQGVRCAAFTLAKHYALGEGVKMDFGRAAYYYRLSQESYALKELNELHDQYPSHAEVAYHFHMELYKNDPTQIASYLPTYCSVAKIINFLHADNLLSPEKKSAVFLKFIENDQAGEYSFLHMIANEEDKIIANLAKTYIVEWISETAEKKPIYTDKRIYFLESFDNNSPEYPHAQQMLADLYYTLHTKSTGFTLAIAYIAKKYYDRAFAIQPELQKFDIFYPTLIKEISEGIDNLIDELFKGSLTAWAQWHRFKYLPADYVEKYIKTLEKVCANDQPNSYALVLLGDLYQLAKRSLDAFFCYRHAAELNNRYGMINLALIYLEDKTETIAKNYDAAFALLKQAAELNSSRAKRYLATLYINGYGVPKNIAKAKELLEEACNANENDAIHLLAEISENKSALLYKAVTRHNPIGMKKLADLYNRQGHLNKKAIDLYDESIKLGTYISMLSLALVYDSQKNYQAATILLKQAVDFGETDALLYLANIYSALKFYDQAIELYKKSLELGDKEAITCLGYSYVKGFGITQDYKKAAELFKEASDLNQPAAMRYLADLYKAGLGVEQNYATAAFFYRKAAIHPDGSSNVRKATMDALCLLVVENKIPEVIYHHFMATTESYLTSERFILLFKDSNDKTLLIKLLFSDDLLVPNLKQWIIFSLMKSSKLTNFLDILNDEKNKTLKDETSDIVANYFLKEAKRIFPEIGEHSGYRQKCIDFLLNQIPTTHQCHAEAQFMLANIYITENNPEAAIESLYSISDTSEFYIEAQLILANIYYDNSLRNTNSPYQAFLEAQEFYLRAFNKKIEHLTPVETAQKSEKDLTPKLVEDLTTLTKETSIDHPISLIIIASSTDVVEFRENAKCFPKEQDFLMHVYFYLKTRENGKKDYALTLEKIDILRKIESEITARKWPSKFFAKFRSLYPVEIDKILLVIKQLNEPSAFIQTNAIYDTVKKQITDLFTNIKTSPSVAKFCQDAIPLFDKANPDQLKSSIVFRN